MTSVSSGSSFSSRSSSAASSGRSTGRWSARRSGSAPHEARAAGRGRRPGLADRDPADPGVRSGAQELVPTFAAPENREFATLVGSDAGQAFLAGAWGWYALILALMVFTIVGEELLFRGFLLPRMNGASDAAIGSRTAAVHRLPPARALGDASDAGGHVHPGLPDEALPQRLDRDRGAQLPGVFFALLILHSSSETALCSLTNPSPYGSYDWHLMCYLHPWSSLTG